MPVIINHVKVFLMIQQDYIYPNVAIYSLKIKRLLS